MHEQTKKTERKGGNRLTDRQKGRQAGKQTDRDRETDCQRKRAVGHHVTKHPVTSRAHSVGNTRSRAARNCNETKCQLPQKGISTN